MLAPMLIELLFGLASEGALRARVRPLPSVVHLVLLELPLCPEHLLTDGTLLGVLGVVNLQMQPQSPQLLETLLALGALKDFVVRVNLENVTYVYYNTSPCYVIILSSHLTH